MQPAVAYFKIGGQKLLGAPRDAEDHRDWVVAFAREVPVRLAAGRLPVAPDVNEEACRFCDFAPLCRVGARVARKGVC